ncbi:MAG TPA: biotin/lipoyl-containing protein [Thermoanaerobaculia bacterium]|nr:biotin/lipoyl-containing protein [Thermoanaerobaculia bacterium]
MRAALLRLGGRTEAVRLEEEGEAVIGESRVAYERTGDRIVVAGRAHRVAAAREGNRVFVWCDGVAYVFERASSARAATPAEHGSDLFAPMPGRVRKVFATVGQSVARGAVLLALEAMKMEHAIRSPREGVVRRVLVAEGDLVDAGAELVELEPSSARA